MRLPSSSTGIAGHGLAMLLAGTLAAACSTAAAAEPDALRLAKAAVAAADNQGQAFAVIDKKNARVFVFDGAGKLRGDSPVLLGLAHGDDSVPGIGERKMSDIRPDERTTPAGRFASEPGRNLQGEDIVWIDYDAAVSMHRVRATNKAERRLERLATPTVADNRISYGCINVPAGFYDTHIRPVLGGRKGVVYVLPETTPMQARFGFMGAG
ncbi:L,D-transpeptidase [Variovorax boronicumulans]|uniref:L,D-transpeptidase n=1 Tax=Variovorax boronicumulans TaxID=436515 RepID=UPI0027D927CD|nr:L,D-transpeptidase [Variovorax boronicumulans]